MKFALRLGVGLCFFANALAVPAKAPTQASDIPSQKALTETIQHIRKLSQELEFELATVKVELQEVKTSNQQVLITSANTSQALVLTLTKADKLQQKVIEVTEWGNAQAVEKDKALERVDTLEAENKVLTSQVHKLKRIICGAAALIVLLICLWLQLPRRIVVATHPVGLYITIAAPVLVFAGLWFRL